MTTATPHLPQKMTAMYQTSYGPPADVLQLRTDLPLPAPKPDQVLLQVHAASPHAGDSHLIRGKPNFIRLLFGGLFNPSIHIPGTDAAGIVAAVGSEVHGLKPGDRVFGDLSASSFGAFAEYAAVDADKLATIPNNCDLRTAATLGVSALAALQGLRDGASVQSGMSVLVTGASGGVGSYAVQIARAWGANVTATCRTEKMDKVKRLGANQIIDYEKEDVTKGEHQFDAVIDAAMFRSPMDYVGIIKEGGKYVAIGGDTKYFVKFMLGLGMWMTRVKKRNASFLESKPTQKDLLEIKALVEEGKVVPLLDDHSFRLADVGDAIRMLEERKVVGKIVVDVVPNES